MTTLSALSFKMSQFSINKQNPTKCLYPYQALSYNLQSICSCLNHLHIKSTFGFIHCISADITVTIKHYN